jgi:acyl carrier protein
MSMPTKPLTTTKEDLITILQEHVRGFNLDRGLADQVDSLSLFSLIPIIEKKFEVTFFSVELDRSQIASVEKLAALIEKKKADKKKHTPLT